MATRGAERPATRRTDAPALGARGSALAVGVVVVCLAIIWPKLLAPNSNADHLQPNVDDRAHGCCDIFAEKDVKLLGVIVDICGSILQRRGELDASAERSLSSGKLTGSIVSVCRAEVRAECGVDLGPLLERDDMRLGKPYKRALDQLRSYNGSACLRDRYGVPASSLGVPHHKADFWLHEDYGVRQERPPHLRTTPMHPALRERGRAITPPTTGGAAPPVGPYQASGPLVQRGPMEGRVGPSPLNVYVAKDVEEPLPMGGMRPPMGGAGGVIPPPKSSVGFVMPLYTLCIVIFFLYTVFKMIFKRQEANDPLATYEHIKPDPEFRRKVFSDNSRTQRSTPDNKLGHKERDARDDELDLLKARLAETERVMERIVMQMRGPFTGQDTFCQSNGSVPHNHANGSIHYDLTNGSVQQESNAIRNDIANALSNKRETTPPSWEDSTPVYEKENIVKEEVSPPPQQEPEEEIREDKEIEAAAEEKEKATVKVLGMEMTAHCEGGQKWMAQRPATPPVTTVPVRHPTPPVTEVSSIYLEGALPHLSRLLVSESETHTEEVSSDDDKDAPVVLSGKMTLSVINDEVVKVKPEKPGGTLYLEDDDFTTASAVTLPKQTDDDVTIESEGEMEEEEVEEEEEIEIDEEVEEEEEEEEEIEEIEYDEEPK